MSSSLPLNKATLRRISEGMRGHASSGAALISVRKALTRVGITKTNNQELWLRCLALASNHLGRISRRKKLRELAYQTHQSLKEHAITQHVSIHSRTGVDRRQLAANQGHTD